VKEVKEIKEVKEKKGVTYGDAQKATRAVKGRR
jgi:hypothetical protein